MTLTLDHTQRLNLHALLGAQHGDVTTIRALWALQDKLALDPCEEKEIELRREFIAGQERVVWNVTLSLPLRHFDLSNAEIDRVRTCLEAWSSYGATADRGWLEPLLSQVILSAEGLAGR